MMKKSRIVRSLKLKNIVSIMILFAIVAMLTMPTGIVFAREENVKGEVDEVVPTSEDPEGQIRSNDDGNDLRSVTLQPGEVDSKDAWIRNQSNYEDNNWGESDDLWCGNVLGQEWRSLIQFDLPTDIAKVESATLKLYSFSAGGNANVTIHAINTQWDEGTGSGANDMAVNWTHRTNTESWLYQGGDYQATPESYRACTIENVWYSFDVMDIVEQWMSGTVDNNGFILTPKYSSGTDYIGFRSSNYSDPSLYPKLVLSYTPFPDHEMEMNDPPEVTNLSEKEFGPVTHQSGSYDSGTNYPFYGGTANQFRYQSLYKPGQVGNEGRITRLSMNRTSLTAGNFSNLEISLAHSELDNLTTTFGDNYIGNLVEVFSEENVEINSSNRDSWVHFDLNGSFIYDSSFNLVVDIQWDGDGGTTIQSHITSDIGTKRVWSIDGGAPGGNSWRHVFRFTTEVLNGSVIDAGTNGYYYPFDESRNYAKMQMLFNSSELGGKQGYIDYLSFYRNDATTSASIFPDLTFSLTHTSVDDLTNTFEDNYPGSLVEVYNVSTFTFESGYGWTDIDIDNVFKYNGQDNLLLEIEWQGSASGVDVYHEAFDGSSVPNFGNRRLFTFTQGSATGSRSEVRYNIRTIFENEWEAQSLDPDLFKAEVDGQDLIVTPETNARGIGTLALTMTNAYPRPLTRNIDVNIRIKDTFIPHDHNEYNNFGGYSEMYSGILSSGNSIRSLVEFNLPPEEGVLKRASLSIYCYSITNSSSNVNVSLSPITNPWFENDLAFEKGAVNWHNRTPGNPWDTPGGDFDTSYKCYRNISAGGIWYDWNITEIVRSWYNGDMDNYGLILTGNEAPGATNDFARLYTSDLWLDDYWPKVSISFGPEEIPDQTMQEDDPTRSIALTGDDYNSYTHISGSMDHSDVWPFYGGSYEESHYHALYTPDQVGVEGKIESISLRRSSMDVGTYNNFNISMAHTSVSDLSLTYADNYEGELVEVYSVSTYETNSSNHDEWLTFDLNGNFTYDSSHNLLIDIQWQGDDDTNIGIEETDGFTTNRRVYGSSISSATGMGRSNDVPVIRFETEVADVSVVDNGTASNMYWIVGPLPFNSGVVDEFHYQMLNKHTELNASGTVDKVRLQADKKGIDWSVVENLSIRMAHSSNESLGPNFEANHIDPWVEVLNRSKYNISSEGKTEWVEIDVDDLFDYNGNDNMVIDIRWRGGYAYDWGINLTVCDTITYNGSLGYADYNSKTGGTGVTWRHNIQTIFKDDPQWQASSSDPSLFSESISAGPSLDITPQPDQFGSGTIDLEMRNCNGYLVNQQNIGVTINAVNDAPELTGPSSIECDEDVDELIDMSTYASDVDNTIDELTFSTNSSYATVDGYNITFNYPEGITEEVVNITVEDPGGLTNYTIADVTVNPVNDAPELTGPTSIECDEDVDEVIDMSTYASDVDNTIDELTFTTDSSYATVDGYNITFNYPEGITEEVVNITVEDPGGLTNYTIADVTVNPVNDAPVLSGVPSTIECDAGEDYVLNMSSYVSDVDDEISELTFFTNSSYASVDGLEITFNYPVGITSEVVNITVEDPGGLTDYSIVDATVTAVGEYPEVTSHTPTGTGVPPHAKVVVGFSMPMDTTATENSFSLLLNGESIDGTFSWNDPDRVMTFTPSEDLADGDYEVIISTDARSASGNNMLSEYSWSFSVSSEDSDDDGMPDDWEENHGLDPNDPSDADEDKDGDGATNLEEYEAGTDPSDPDDYPEEEEEEDESMFLPVWMIALIIIIIIAIIAAIAMMMRSRGGGYEEPPMEPGYEEQPPPQEPGYEEGSPGEPGYEEQPPPPSEEATMEEGTPPEER